MQSRPSSALALALLMSFPVVAKQLQPLAALGPDDLDHLPRQSLVCTTLSYHWGFGLIGKVNCTGMLQVTVVLFSLQIIFSMWWLKRFRFGPVEWFWRSLAYGKKLPNRFSPPASLAR